MKKIHLYLCGGLGNQLFEYAAAKNLAIKHNAKLLLDTKSGFYTDFRDSTKFSLRIKLNDNSNLSKFNLFFLSYRFLNKFISFEKHFSKLLNFKIIDESKYKFFDKKFLDIQFKNKIFLIGYFQSHLYFKENENEIIQQIYPSKPTNINYLNLKDKISKENSVCIGVRMHENIDKEFGLKINKDRKKRMIDSIGGITPIEFYLNALEKILKKIQSPEFFIFSTKKSNINLLISKSKILKKYPVTFITAENGFEDAYDNLWLMSHSKNFIISNSTLYWWGAYFARKKNNSNIVLCSSNFPNKDTCLKDWEIVN